MIVPEFAGEPKLFFIHMDPFNRNYHPNKVLFLGLLLTSLSACLLSSNVVASIFIRGERGQQNISTWALLPQIQRFIYMYYIYNIKKNISDRQRARVLCISEIQRKQALKGVPCSKIRQILEKYLDEVQFLVKLHGESLQRY